MIIFDQRWMGDHGIGRFAHEVYKSEIYKTNVKLKTNPAGIFDVFLLTLYLLLHNDIYYSPGYNAPFFFLKRSIITIHDLNHIDFKENSSFLKRLYYQLILKRACRKSRRIFTVSNFSKQRIVQWSGVAENKVYVLGNGVSDVFNCDVEKHKKYSNYILVVGNRKPHKNEHIALEAFLQSDIDLNTKILFTGLASEKLSIIIEKYNAKDRVIFLGRVNDSELASLYRTANFLLFPSLYEGFGLPVIEAMSCGTAVITSNSTSLIEIANDAALLVDPTNVKSIIQAIELFSNSPQTKLDYINKGLYVSKNYSWDMIRKKFDMQLREAIINNE